MKQYRLGTWKRLPPCMQNVLPKRCTASACGDWRGEEVQGNSVRLDTQSDSDKLDDDHLIISKLPSLRAQADILASTLVVSSLPPQQLSSWFRAVALKSVAETKLCLILLNLFSGNIKFLVFEVGEIKRELQAFEAWELRIGSSNTIRCASFIAQSVRNLGLTQSYVAAGHPKWLDHIYPNDRSASGGN
ncbi:hypothetical protein YC2023_069971 [Brassica napus]